MWEDKLLKRQIGGWVVVSAAGLQGLPEKECCFHRHRYGRAPKCLRRRRDHCVGVSIGVCCGYASGCASSDHHFCQTGRGGFWRTPRCTYVCLSAFDSFRTGSGQTELSQKFPIINSHGKMRQHVVFPKCKSLSNICQTAWDL